MKCKDCPYFWAEGDGDFTCQYRWNDGYAPCEVSELIETEDYDEYD